MVNGSWTVNVEGTLADHSVTGCDFTIVDKTLGSTNEISITASDTEIEEGNTTGSTITVSLPAGYVAPVNGVAVALTITGTDGASRTSPTGDFKVDGVANTTASFPKTVTIPEGQGSVTLTLTAGLDDILYDDGTVSFSFSGTAPTGYAWGSPGSVAVAIGYSFWHSSIYFHLK